MSGRTRLFLSSQDYEGASPISKHTAVDGAEGSPIRHYLSFFPNMPSIVLHGVVNFPYDRCRIPRIDMYVGMRAVPLTRRYLGSKRAPSCHTSSLFNTYSHCWSFIYSIDVDWPQLFLISQQTYGRNYLIMGAAVSVYLASLRSARQDKPGITSFSETLNKIYEYSLALMSAYYL